MHNLTPAELVAACRKKYPVQTRADNAGLGIARCVGAAFCEFLGFRTGPLVESAYLAKILQSETRIDDEAAESAAAEIIRLNDAGNFDAAWIALEQTLQSAEARA